MENAQKIVDKIQQNDIKPIPRYRFILRSLFIWLTFVIFIVIGAISFSVILYTIQQSSFDLLSHSNHSSLEFLLVLFPIVWLVSLLIFILASMWTARYSKKAYKIKPGVWLLYSTSLSIVIGSLFFISGGGAWFERSFANKLEIYQSLEERKVSIWSMPEKGNLSGIIQKVRGDTLEIIDHENKHWTILVNQAFIAPVVLIEQGEKIKINGKMVSDSVYEATDIRPWGGKKYNSGRKNERKGKGPRNQR